jgi:hypothetical protein
VTHLRWLWADHGHFYGPTSGWVPDLTMLGILGAWYKKHECHEDGCYWPARHTVVDPITGEHIVRCRRCHRKWKSTVTPT